MRPSAVIVALLAVLLLGVCLGMSVSGVDRGREFLCLACDESVTNGETAMHLSCMELPRPEFRDPMDGLEGFADPMEGLDK